MKRDGGDGRDTGAGWATPGLPRSDLAPVQQRLRMLAVRLFLWLATRAVLRVRLEGRDRIPAAPAMYCFNHLNWLDPIVLMAAFPLRSRLYFYGPREADMRVGGRNRLMWWSGISVPFRPGKDDLVTSVRRSEAVFRSGAMLAIAGEGRIHVHEGDLMPLQEGTAYLALRARVPIVPVAITGTSWVGFRRTVVVRSGGADPDGAAPDARGRRSLHGHDLARPPGDGRQRPRSVRARTVRAVADRQVQRLGPRRPLRRGRRPRASPGGRPDPAARAGGARLIQGLWHTRGDGRHRSFGEPQGVPGAAGRAGRRPDRRLGL